MDDRDINSNSDNGAIAYLSSVSLDECFPLDQPPASSTESIGFSSHNILQVCSRWIVYLYLSNSLNAPGAEIVPRQHPLCHFSEKDSIEYVVGAKWSGTLIPEVRYPAESRLCVLTTSSLIVYRVTRHGDTRLDVSRGIGIGTPRSYRNALRRQTDENRSQRTPSPRSATSKKSRNTKKTKTAKTRKKRKRSSSEESSVYSDLGSEEEQGDELESAESTGNATHVSASQANALDSADPVLLDVVWLPNDVLVVMTTVGLHVLSFENDFSDEGEAVMRCLDSPTHAFADDFLGLELAPPSCLSTVRTSPLVLSDRSAEGVFISDLIVVTSAFISRVFAVKKDRVTFLQYVESPLVSSVPSCMCALVETTPLNEEAQVTLLISCPTNTVCGTFTVTCRAPTPYSRAVGTATSPSPSTPPAASLLALRHVYTLADKIHNDPFIRGFQVMPVTSTRTSIAENGSAPFLVFGIAQRAYYGLTLTNPVPSTLFRCPSLVTLDTLPPSTAVAVCGLAVHPSTALAIALLHTGYVLYPPLQLLPLSAGDTRGPLHRQLTLTGVFDGILETHPDMETRSAASRSNLYLQWLWQHQRDVGFFTWEPLFTLSTACTALHGYVDGRTFLTNKKTFLRKLSILSSSATSLTPSALWPATCALRDQYRHLRDKWGVELFLRWPAPTDTTAPPSTVSHAGEARWWHLLLQLWRQHPWDPSALVELTLANAVRVLAVATNYAHMKLSAGEAVRDLEDHCAPSASTLSVESALCFVQLYMEHVKDCLLTMASESTRSPTSPTPTSPNPEDGASLLTPRAYAQPAHPADARRSGRHRNTPPFLLPWAATATWENAVRLFLKSVDGAAVLGHPNRRVHTNADMATVRFPCSVCDAPSVATFNLSFRCSSVHPPHHAEPGAQTASPEAHVTLFSGTTFSPLSMFCEDCVLTRCLGCGFADYATGPLCRLCGGLLL